MAGDEVSENTGLTERLRWREIYEVFGILMGDGNTLKMAVEGYTWYEVLEDEDVNDGILWCLYSEDSAKH